MQFEKERALAAKEGNVIYSGRRVNYQYCDIGRAIALALRESYGNLYGHETD